MHDILAWMFEVPYHNRTRSMNNCAFWLTYVAPVGWYQTCSVSAAY